MIDPFLMAAMLFWGLIISLVVIRQHYRIAALEARNPMGDRDEPEHSGGPG